ncbi:alanine-glyoxylate transaminase / serine-glyoxylate transaminase / serine-pyruvate transaminase [Tistlia consotensis]|uniref:Alanine-glyoxylate transaminase / serine-glyoxylate transaminase / serine-pyruvate transaminase n=1 Tax=Tistlia consotensis USBA 355 TaxID=560819 RepID=A0A1Y6BLY4_9PROT|nr:aminotransferase class V-fold PLP-dependent enzyme [Tistlia consotensis]SMF18613.1 alanine-glyoxylate transaminase / serine-glyoxylate transaminase / serine-pyruvate transaminase [Tistlia consotensis USBA 355]SNR39580.1 alanine-glyoxylate transaminase / serine-glyoxylate transaminase / serine-pyruvate transaminase [Tistlia consotensis]
MKRLLGPEFLMIPGPTSLPDRVRTAMSSPAMDFSGEAFAALAERAFRGLKPIFRTEGEIFLYAANGHGAWEAALANCLQPGETVLVPETGLFARVWRQMAADLGLETQAVETDWRHAVAPERIEAILRDDTAGRIKAVMVVHTDTAASVCSDLRGVRAAIDAAGHPALLMVDAIASLCTTDFAMDDWGIDVTVAAAQKALMVPPGLSIVAAGPKALERCQAGRHLPGSYWMWQARLGKLLYQRFCGTAPIQHVAALGEALAMIEEPGLPAVIEQHRRLAAMVQAAVERWGSTGFLEFNALVPAERAASVTSVRVPGDFDAERIRDHARLRYGLTIGGGLGPLKGQIFRIGHMGFLNEAYVLGALGVLQATFRDLGLPVGDGALEAAIAATTASPG